MKIIFFGSSHSSVPSFRKILEAGHTISLVVTQPDKPSGRGKKVVFSPIKKAALDLHVPVLQPQKIRTDLITLKKIEEVLPDLNVVVAFGQIIPRTIFDLPKHRSINVHFSLLPKYRGASPVQWALFNGETATGITIFELNEKMDEGDILAQEIVNIFPEESSPDLEKRLSELGADMLVKTIENIDKIIPRKQDHNLATYAPRLKKEDGLILWKSGALQIERQVRAFHPWPSSFTFFRGKRLKIIKGKTDGLKAPLSKPGEILAVRKEGLSVVCGGGSAYIIQILQPENKKVMEAYAFSRGAQIEVGDIFE